MPDPRAPSSKIELRVLGGHKTAVIREKKLAEPRAPKTVPDAPAPKAAPASVGSARQSSSACSHALPFGAAARPSR